jgi:hypothetical protein
MHRTIGPQERFLHKIIGGAFVLGQAQRGVMEDIQMR